MAKAIEAKPLWIIEWDLELQASINLGAVPEAQHRERTIVDALFPVIEHSVFVFIDKEKSLNFSIPPSEEETAKIECRSLAILGFRDIEGLETQNVCLRDLVGSRKDGRSVQ